LHKCYKFLLDRKIFEFFYVLAWGIGVISLKKSAEIFGGREFELFCGFAYGCTLVQQKNGFL
jgi:hypothetical protein